MISASSWCGLAVSTEVPKISRYQNQQLSLQINSWYTKISQFKEQISTQQHIQYQYCIFGFPNIKKDYHEILCSWDWWYEAIYCVIVRCIWVYDRCEMQVPSAHCTRTVKTQYNSQHTKISTYINSEHKYLVNILSLSSPYINLTFAIT